MPARPARFALARALALPLVVARAVARPLVVALPLVFALHGCWAFAEAEPAAGSPVDDILAAAKDLPPTGDDSGAAPAKTFRTPTELFDPVGLHTVAVTLAPADWQTLLANAKDPTLPRAYAKATVTVDGVVFADVGVRNFGDGSQQENPGKPNLRLKFDAFVPERDGPEGQRNLRLKASGTEPTFLREPLFYRLLAALGQPAPRWSFARVTVGGEPYGLYQLVEAVDKRLFERAFGNDDGPLYEPKGICVGLECGPAGCGKLDKAFESKTGTFADLKALVQAVTDAPDAELEAQLAAHADLDSLLAVYAAEAVASEVDGILASGANFALYRDEKVQKFRLLRTGADETFYEAYDPLHPYGPPNLMCPQRVDPLFARVLKVPALKAKLLDKMRALTCGPLKVQTVVPWIEQHRPWLAAERQLDPKTQHTAQGIDEGLDELEAWIVQRTLTVQKLVGACP